MARFGWLTVVVSALALALPQAALAGWIPVGGQLSDSSRTSHSADIASIQGTPWVVWAEDAAPSADLGVRSWNGSSWVTRPSPQGQASTHGAEQVDIASVGGEPYIVYTEKAFTTYPEIYVKRWNGSAWVAVGALLNVGSTTSASATYARDPQIVANGAAPCVTWWETPQSLPDRAGGDVYVKCFNGSTWGAPIGGAIRTTSTQNATAPSLAFIAGELHVAWTELPASEIGKLPGEALGGVIHVAHRTASAWVPIGQPLQPAGSFAHLPDLIEIDDVPWLAWQEHDPSPPFSEAKNRVWVSRYTGITWDSGNGIASNVGFDAAGPRIAEVGGLPWVTYSEADFAGANNFGQRSVRVRRPSQNGTWESLEGLSPIKKDTSHNAGPGGLVEIGGIPHLAFLSVEIYVDRWLLSVQNTSPPTVSGTPRVGETLTCNPGTWTNQGQGSLTYQYWWESGARDQGEGKDVFWTQSADGQQYTVRPENAGGRVRCRVFAQNGNDIENEVSQSKRTDTGVPANSLPPTIDGTGVTGTTHTCDPGTWSPEGDFSYQWRQGGNVVIGATQKTYVPSRVGQSQNVNTPDSAHRLVCEVFVQNDVGLSAAVTSADVYLVDEPPIAYNLPAVVGDVPDANPLGRELTCSEGDWTDDYARQGLGGFGYEYQWSRNGAPVPGAVAKTYTTTVDDLGTDLACTVVNTNPAGRSAPFGSFGRRIPLPAVTKGGEMMTVAGKNQYVPVNMLAIGRQYQTLVDQYALRKLSAARFAEATRCRGELGGNRLQQGEQLIEQIELGQPVDPRARCAILNLHSDSISVYADGVKYMDKCRTSRSNYAGVGGVQECLDLGFAVPPVDPTKPPPLDFPDQARLAAVTPTQVLWDVNNDGLTDATCPGSAPVMRAMLGRGQWNPRAILVYPDSTTSGVFSEARTPGAFTNPPHTPGPTGALRDAQPFMCRTSLEQPPDPQSGPCVTDGTIGRVRITGNLCPISIRTLTQQQVNNIQVNNPELLPVLQKFALDAERREANGRRRRAVVYAETASSDLVPRGFLGGDKSLSSTLENTASARSVFESTGVMAERFQFESVLPARTFPTLKPAEAANFALDQMYISQGLMKINGVSVIPNGTLPGLVIPSDVQEGIDKVRSLTNMKVLVSEAKTQLGNFVTAEKKRIEAEFKESATEAVQGLLQTDFVLPENGFELGPLKFHGKIDFKLNKDQTATITARADVPLLKLSPGGSNITAEAVLSGDREGNIKLESIELSLDRAYLYGIELEGLNIRYDGGLTVRGKLKFGANAGSSIELHYFRINANKSFGGLDVEYQAPAGLGIQVGPGIYLVGIRGGYVEPERRLTAGATFTIGPSTGGCPAFGLTGTINVSWPSYVQFQSTADIVAACIPLAKINFVARSTGYVELSGTVNFREGPVFINGGIGGTFDSTRKYKNTDQPLWQIEARAHGGIKDVPIVGDIEATVQGVLANSGLSVCGEVEILGEEIGAGVGVRFNNGVPPLVYADLVRNLRLFTGCSLSSWRVLPTLIGGTRAHAAQAGPTTFEIADDQRGIALSFPGADGTPRVRLRSPDGKTYDFTDAVDGKRVENAYGVQIEEENRTVVLVSKPAGGRWTVELGEGSPALGRIESAQVLPEPQVRGRVGGIGSSRVLRYDVRRIPGQQVRLIEQVKGAHRELRVVRGGGKGTIRFRTAEADTTRRAILAEVTQDGIPRANIVVTRFTAPNPKIGRARKVRVRRRGRTAVVTWRRAILAERYDVLVETGDGGRSVLSPSGKRLRVTVPAVTKGEGVVVRVVGISPSGRRGPAARVRLKGSLTLGKAKPEKPRRKPRKRRRG